MARYSIEKIVPGATTQDIFGNTIQLGNRSLNATSTVSAGDEFALQLPPGRLGRITWLKDVAAGGGGFSALQVDLEGSIDGTNWFQLDTSSATGDSQGSIVNQLVNFVRTSIISRTISGGSPTVTTWIMVD